MTPDTIINRLAAEALHQDTVDGIRQVVAMAYSAGVNDGHSDHSGFKNVACIDASGNIKRTYKSTHEAARALGGSQGNIAKSARDGKWKAYGYKWKYV